MRKLSMVLVILAMQSGCTTTPGTNAGQLPKDEPTAGGSLNRQIEKFNANRIPNMGVTPIDRRVLRVEHDPELDLVTTFDQDGKPFLVLNREADGRFKGVVKTPYHQAAFSGPDGSHSWGHVLAEFYLEKEMF